MTLIEKTNKNGAALLSEIAGRTFLESHGMSASSEDISNYISEKYNQVIFEAELLNTKNNYNIIHHQNRVAGFSNIIFSSPYINSNIENIAKLERLYLLAEFHNLKLGLKLFEFNIDLAKQHNQEGVWLYVWKENHRAINFYKKNGFSITGSYDFKISETHSNPNHQMFLQF